MDLDDRGIVMKCPSCGTMNRLVYRTLDRATRCGKCRTALPSPASPIDIKSAAAFDALVSSSVLPVVVDFWAPWCGPCRMMAPEVEKAARRLAGDAIVVKLNTETEPALAGRFGIQSIPTLAVFRDGRETGRLVGARPAADIEALVPQRTGAGRTGRSS